MALELPHGRDDTASPVSSGGRDSPVPRLWRGEDEDYSRDKGFRRYASAVDRALSLFDTQLQEWADYISFLGRLLKALQSHPSNLSVVPSKTLVARRLAQCLAPSLPSGVHQKALEVYGYIFMVITPTGVARDLSLYLPGLSPVLSFASLTVRSPFLALLRQHILPLPAQILRPACKALILTLLPGLEDEGSEDFDTTFKLLIDFRNALRTGEGLEDAYFWQCFFLATIASPSRRLGALAYLVRELPKLGSGTSSTNDVHEDTAKTSAKMLTSPEPGLLVRCFAAGLRDDQILIQRGFLDLLVTHLPLHAWLFKSIISPADLELLMTAASSVVARRDMSLNRRLWSWLLGPEPIAPADERPTSSGTDKAATASRTEYFETFGLKPLTKSIIALIDGDSSEASERAKPFRICLSLMDRWEIGGLVVPLVFLPAMRSVKRYQLEDGVDKKHFQEVLRSASVFFNGVESGLIWSEINSLLFDSLPNNTAEMQLTEQDTAMKLENVELVRFIISHFNIREDDMLAIHIPHTALGIVSAANTQISDVTEERLHVNNVAIMLALELIAYIPPTLLSPSPPKAKASPETVDLVQNTNLDDGSISIRLQAFYQQHQGDISSSPPPFSSAEISELLLRKATTLFISSLSTTYPRTSDGAGYNHNSQSAVVNVAKLFLLIFSKASPEDTDAPKPALPTSKALSSNTVALFDVFKSTLGFSKMFGNDRLPFSTTSAIQDTILALYPRYLDFEQIYELVPLLVRQFWERLDPRAARYHVEAVRCIWSLHYALCKHAPNSGEHLVEGCVSNLMLDAKGICNKDDPDAVGSFGVLWLHSLGDDKDRNCFRSLITRPLFLVLDLLAVQNGTQRWGEFGDAKRWIQGLQGNALSPLFQTLVSELPPLPLLQTGDISDEDGMPIPAQTLEMLDCSSLVYTMQTLGRILDHALPETWHVFSTATIHFQPARAEKGGVSFQWFFAMSCVRGMIAHGKGQSDYTTRDSINALNKGSLRLLGQLLCDSNTKKGSPDMEEVNALAAKVLCSWLDKLNQDSYGSDTALQTEILEVLGKSLRLQTDFGAWDRARQAKVVQPVLPEKQSSGDKSQTLPNPATGAVSPPRNLIAALQTTIMGGLLQRAAVGVMNEWAALVRECIRLNVFEVQELERLGNACLRALDTGHWTLSESFQTRKERDREMDVEYKGIEGERSMGARIDILECLVLKAHELATTEDILMLEAKGRKSTTRDERTSEKGFLGGIFGSAEGQASEQLSKDTPITPRQRIQLQITEAVRTVFTIWHWAESGKKSLEADAKHSFHYTSLKLRSRARKLLETLFQREAGVCMETVVAIWTSTTKDIEKAALQLTNVLDATRPHNAMSLLFELIHDRVSASQFGQVGGQAPHKDTTVTDLVAFLNAYTLTLEPDAVVEIWGDAAAFLRDVLANPMTYRTILPGLLHFLGLVGEKISNTLRGRSDKGMRREVADLWLRILTAVFTTNPAAWQNGGEALGEDAHARHKPQDIVSVLAELAKSLPAVLHDNTLLLQAVTTISTSILQPTIRAKSFPANTSRQFLTLFLAIGKLGSQLQNSSSAGIMKIYKRDVSEAFSHPSFFSLPSSLFEAGWAPLLKLWVAKDRERIMSDLLSRLAPPTTAGIVFGVGATSARQDADQRTKGTLKRVTALILADAADAWVAQLPGIYDKIVELLTATTTSSPSSATRGDVYILLRALVARTSDVHLSFLWPGVNAELEGALGSCLRGGESREAEREREVWDAAALGMGCRLLGELVRRGPEEWVGGEWMFVGDCGAGAAGGEGKVALLDRLVEELGAGDGEEGGLEFEMEGVEREDVIARLRPFFAQLGKREFERVMGRGRGRDGERREEETWRAVVRDVFEKEESGEKGE